MGADLGHEWEIRWYDLEKRLLLLGQKVYFLLRHCYFAFYYKCTIFLKEYVILSALFFI